VRMIGRSIPQLAAELGVSPQSLRNWRRQLAVDAGAEPGLMTDERAELRRLRREVRLLSGDREILETAVFFAKEGGAVPGDDVPSIATRRTEHSIAILCRVLEVSRSGYHAWTRRPLSPRPVEEARLTARICELFPKRCGVYGSPRISSSTTASGSRASASSGSCASPASARAPPGRGAAPRSAVPGVRVRDGLVHRKFADGVRRILALAADPLLEIDLGQRSGRFLASALGELPQHRGRQHDRLQRVLLGKSATTS
jgi:transposase-like protein